MSQRILIVGAGPTGLTAAVELARQGVIPTVIERRPGASQLSRAVGILQHSMDIFAPSGVAEAIDAEAVRFAGVIFHQGASRIARLPLNFSDRSRIWGLAQDRTEAHLSAAFTRCGGRIRYGAALETLTQDGDGVSVTVEGAPERYDLVIAADGIHSTVRQTLGLSFDGYDLPDRWSIADVESDDWPDADHFKGYLLPEGKVAVVVPLERTRFRVIASAPDALKALPVPMAVCKIRRSGAFTISVRQVSAYQKGRVFLAGDAAHCHSPVGGRGMNLGIADAADLVGRILSGRTDGYHAARHAAGAHVLRLSENARQLLQSQSGAKRAVLRTVFRVAAAVPPLGRVLMEQFVSR
ncbi:MAG: FAD-dependent oxidoreductase [Rhodobacteraceae bacterium]|nr:FAD-dependent oxidoreductase [Paracoccaceae bacterium]